MSLIKTIYYEGLCFVFITIGGLYKQLYANLFELSADVVILDENHPFWKVFFLQQQTYEVKFHVKTDTIS